MSRRLPRGRVTFAFVDVVESTRIFAEHGEAFVAALAMLQDRVARHTRAAGGVVVKTEGRRRVPGDALLHAAEAVRLIPLPGPRRRFMLLQLARAQAKLGDDEAAAATACEIETELRDSGRPPERVLAEVAELREQLPSLTASPVDLTPRPGITP